MVSAEYCNVVMLLVDLILSDIVYDIDVNIGH